MLITSYPCLRCEEELFMAWYIVYKGKAQKDSLQHNLEKAGVEYFRPTQATEHLEDDQMKIKEEDVIKNLIFLNTDQDILSLVNAIDGLRCPYIDRATGSPAIVPDTDMKRFMRFLELKNIDARVLQDPYYRFKTKQKVRVRAGEFEGVEGYVFRIRGDRKLVISLGDMAIAISGIHHTLLEPINEKNGGVISKEELLSYAYYINQEDEE